MRDGGSRAGTQQTTDAAASRGDGHPVAAAAVLAASLTLALASVVLFLLNDPHWTAEQWYFAVDLADAVVYGLVAWLVLTRRSHPVAWILAVTAVGGGLAALSFEWTEWLAAHPDAPVLNPLPSAQSWAWVPGTLALVVIVPWLVRDEPLDRVARLALGLGAALTASLVLVRVTDPFPWPDGPTMSPLPIRSQTWVDASERAFTSQVVALVVLGLVAAADVARRWRSRPLEQRRGLGWLAIGVVPLALSFLPLALPETVTQHLPVSLTPAMHLASQLFFPAAVLVAVLRQRLWGIDLAVSRTLVWALLTAGVVAAYVAAVAALSPLLSRDRAPEVLATALVAAGFQPARSWLQRRVERLVRGDGANPLRAVRRVGRHLGAAGGAEDVLASVVTSVATSLRLGSAAIELEEGASGLGDGFDEGFGAVAQIGDAVGEEVVVPLRSGLGTVGRLVVTARPGERLDGRTRASLAELAPVVAATVQMAATTRALSASRRRLAEARDEERRALRRELHDGLGPALAGVSLGLQAARNMFDASPTAAVDLLDRLSAELDSRIEEVRGLARGLLPPTLGELGLEPALAELAERYAVTGLDVELRIDGDGLADLAPEVATAVYAIVSEAVRNVHRHAGASRCRVEVARGPDLVVVVADDGVGLSADTRPGVGLTSMRERAEGLGGSFRLGAGNDSDDSGDGRVDATRVEVRIPEPALAAAG